ncbi:cytochrome b/b6 domain-containing protein [uncultured Shimia sp.]|uniref:cytochrome b n=1 Tax=uncultured Shimia sp. TaxID=573152 RepID=UPI0026307E78|nr:cytochrome b/b6 domain-containing protein [uncultured Shimia sp.]
MTRYHPFLVFLHWLLALMIIGGLIMGGNVLAETPNDDPFKLVALRMHMAMGILILALMVIRLVVRLVTTKPPHADIGNARVNKLGTAAHWLFYVVVIAMCASGLAIANMAGLPAIVFGGSGAPLPSDFSAFPPRMAHGALATVLTLLILGHVGAGLWHQFVTKDGLFGRMWFGKRS